MRECERSIMMPKYSMRKQSRCLPTSRYVPDGIIITIIRYPLLFSSDLPIASFPPPPPPPLPQHQQVFSAVCVMFAHGAAEVREEDCLVPTKPLMMIKENDDDVCVLCVADSLGVHFWYGGGVMYYSLPFAPLSLL